MSITWYSADEMDAMVMVPSDQDPWCKILVVDLRDARILPLLSPAPLATDYKDEARPATNDRAYFLARRAALRSLVGSLFDIPADEVHIAYDDDGAPRVINPGGAHVSVSGHGPYAMLAIASHPCGIDFEPLQQDIKPIADVLHPREQQELAALRADERKAYFLRIWTAKEAYLKALGKGFLNDPQAVRTQFSDGKIDISDNNQTVQQTGILRHLTVDGADLIAACIVIA